MAFTKVTASGISSATTLTIDSINSVGVVTASTVQVGSATTIHTTGIDLGSGNITSHNINSTGIITATGAVITGNLQVDGTTTTLDTIVTEVDKLEVSANNTNVAVAVTQSGTGDILRLYDGATQAVTVKDGGSVGIGTDNPTAILEVFDETSNTILNVKSGDAGAVINLLDPSQRSSIEQSGTTLKISSDTGAEFANSDIRLQVDGSTKVLVNSGGHTLFSGLTSHNDSTRNVSGITVKSGSGISFQNFGSNGSRNWRLRPDDLTSWGSLEFSVSPTDNDDADWPDALSDVVLELKKDKNVKITNGNLIIGTSGKGIDFSATSDATGSTSELLDDYEEGTFTPVWGDGSSAYSSPAPTYNLQRGDYTKIGNVVYYDIHLITTAWNSSPAVMWAHGLPFASRNSGYQQGGGGIFCIQGVDGANAISNLTTQVAPNTSRIELYYSTASTGNNYNGFTTADVNETGTVSIRISGFYFTDS